MKLSNILYAGVAAVLVSSCGIYNKYERPDVNTNGIVRDSALATVATASGDTATFGNLPWRQVFTDSQLQQLIERGLENNPNLLNAALNVKMAKAQLSASRLAFLPAFSFGPQAHSAHGTAISPRRSTPCPSRHRGTSISSAICSTRSVAPRWHSLPRRTIR